MPLPCPNAQNASLFVTQSCGYALELLLGLRYRNTGDITDQRNADAYERHTEKIELAEHNITNKHCQSDSEQER